MRKRWPKLTRFLEVAGAPLDNNIVERALKLILMFRKNSYFYKTENGAKNGDILTSIIETCILCKTNPIEYLEVIQEYCQEVAKYPEKWHGFNVGTYRWSLRISLYLGYFTDDYPSFSGKE